MPASSPGNPAGLHLHVENQPDGLHVWIGIPAQHGLGDAALVGPALLQARLEALATVARLVVNGRDASVERARPHTCKEHP